MMQLTKREAVADDRVAFGRVSAQRPVTSDDLTLRSAG
jgi:hypothetical protein